MEKSGGSAYVYAKASGILGKSFVGSRSENLFNAQSLSELWEMVFNSPVPSVPEVLLANKIENEASRKFIHDYLKLLEVYSNPDRFLVSILDRIEVENLKVFAASASLSEQNIPRFTDLGKYAVLDYKAYPDIQKMTKGTVWEWYDHVPSLDERQKLSYRLDLFEIKDFWDSLNHIGDNTRDALVEFYRKDLSIKNMIWALRLKVYYNMSALDIVQNLFYVGIKPCIEDPICGYAFAVLDKAVDSFDDWQSWHFARYLNPHVDGVVWKVDPVWIEQRFRADEAKNALQIFHQYPMTTATLAMYFRLKQQELNCIRAATEALRLGVASHEAMFAAGISVDVE